MKLESPSTPTPATSVETKVETSAQLDEYETAIGTMEPGDIKKLIVSTQRTGRLSLPADTRTKRRPVSMDVSSSYGALKPSGLLSGARSISSENLTLLKPVTVILKGDDDSTTAVAKETTSIKTSSSMTQQSSSYRTVYSRQGDTRVGFEGLKGIEAEEHRIGSPIEVTLGGVSTERTVSSSSTMSSSTSSRITMTTQSHVRKVPSLSRTFPELLDEEIRQVKASTEKSGDTMEDRRRWSMEKRSEWMLSSPTSESSQTGTDDGQERKRLTLRERKRLLLGHDDDQDSQKDKPRS